MSTLSKVERLMDLLPDIDFPYACNLFARISRKMGEPFIGEPCLHPDIDGVDCHSRSGEKSTWCATCAAFAIEIGEV